MYGFVGKGLGRGGRGFWGVGVGVVDVGCLKKHPKSGKFGKF